MIHRAWHPANQVQGCVLLNIKSGGCPEDCAYCPQSAHYKTSVTRGELAERRGRARGRARARARRARRASAWARRGATCRRAQPFQRVLEMVRGVRGLGLEACCTLGMLNDEQAEALAERGLTAYNHNLDTSPGVLRVDHHHPDLRRSAGDAATGPARGYHGLLRRHHRHGRETARSRWRLLQQLATQDPHPESVPINLLVAVEGTPLARSSARRSDRAGAHDCHRSRPDARVVRPAQRRAACRSHDEAQALCFLAGANSVFMGEKLLTTANPDVDDGPAAADSKRARASACRPTSTLKRVATIPHQCEP